MILAASLVCGIAATLAAMLVPERLQLTLPVARSAAVGEVVIPYGHWILVAVWTAVVLSAAVDRRRQFLKCIAIGFAVHALLLVALFVPRLADREAFSSNAYLLYAWMFCAGAIAAATAWAGLWIARMRVRPDVWTMSEAVLVPAWFAVVIAGARHHVALAVAGLAAGGAIYALIRHGRVFTTGLARLAASDRAWMAAIFIVALALRLLYVDRIMMDANYLDAGADGRVYDRVASSIANGEGVPSSFAERYPLLLLGYVYFAAAIYAIADHSYAALTMVQSLLGATACVLIFMIARAGFDRWTALVAAAFTAVSFPLIFAAATIGHQALDVFLTALTIWLMVHLLQSSAPPQHWAVAGAVAGLGFTVRETNVLFLAFAVIWIASVQNVNWRRAMPAVAAFTAGSAIVVAPFLAPKIWSADGRQRMRQHFDRLYRAEGVPGSLERRDLVGPMADPRGALTQLRSEPGRVIATLVRGYWDNFAVQFLTQPYGGFDIVFLRKGTEYYYGMWFYAYALTAAGAWLVATRMRIGGTIAACALLILLLIVARTVPHLVLESDYRHRVPLEPFLILLASVAAVAVLRAVTATAASASTSGFTGSDWRVSHSNGRWTPVT